MALLPAAKDLMLEALNGITYLSLHSAYDQTLTGQFEFASGELLPYTRRPVVWAAAAGGTKIQSGVTMFNITPGIPVRWIGLWDAPVGGNCWGMIPAGGVVTGSIMGVRPFSAPDLTNWTLHSPAHGLLNGNQIWLFPPLFGGALPTGVVPGTYYVISALVDPLNVFQVSLTPGGPPVQYTTLGAGNWTYAGAATHAAQRAFVLWSDRFLSPDHNYLDLDPFVVWSGDEPLPTINDVALAEGWTVLYAAAALPGSFAVATAVEAPVVGADGFGQEASVPIETFPVFIGGAAQPFNLVTYALRGRGHTQRLLESTALADGTFFVAGLMLDVFLG